MSRSGTTTTSAIPFTSFTRVCTDITPAQPSWKFPSTTKISTITELSCYHGALRGEEAEERLKQQPVDSHLVRYSDNKEEYILTVLKRVDNGTICQHFVIKTLPPPHNAYTVEGSDRIFQGASKMLKYFRKNPITYKINGIGKPCNHNHSKATHYSSSDDSDSSDDWQDTLETHLTPPWVEFLWKPYIGRTVCREARPSTLQSFSLLNCRCQLARMPRYKTKLHMHICSWSEMFNTTFNQLCQTTPSAPMLPATEGSSISTPAQEHSHIPPPKRPCVNLPSTLASSA